MVSARDCQRAVAFQFALAPACQCGTSRNGDATCCHREREEGRQLVSVPPTRLQPWPSLRHTVTDAGAWRVHGSKPFTLIPAQSETGRQTSGAVEQFAVRIARGPRELEDVGNLPRD